MRRAGLALAAGVLALAAVPGSAAAAPGPANAPEYWFDSWHVPALWSTGARGQGAKIEQL